MYKRYSKKLFSAFLLFIISISYISVVFAAGDNSRIEKYTFTGDGSEISVYSNGKYKNHIALRADREYQRDYHGTFRFILYKKNIFGNYKEYGRQFKDTYNVLCVNASWDNMSNAEYKGSLQLYDNTETFYTGITTNFYISYVAGVNSVEEPNSVDVINNSEEISNIDESEIM